MSTLTDISSTDELALFNPAFLSVLLHAAAADHEKAAARTMPASVPFLLIPLALHKPTRADLPLNASAQMQRWIRENPRHLVGLDTRVRSMRPFVGAALRFATLYGVVLTDDALLRAGTLKRRPNGFAAGQTEDALACQRAARFLGRWFARQPDSATLLALWGLRP